MFHCEFISYNCSLRLQWVGACASFVGRWFTCPVFYHLPPLLSVLIATSINNTFLLLFLCHARSNRETSWWFWLLRSLIRAENLPYLPLASSIRLNFDFCRSTSFCLCSTCRWWLPCWFWLEWHHHCLWLDVPICTLDWIAEKCTSPHRYEYRVCVCHWKLYRRFSTRSQALIKYLNQSPALARRSTNQASSLTQPMLFRLFRR